MTGNNETSRFWVENSGRLTELWQEGKSGSEIAAVLGCTRDAAIARANRIGLPARPSPIVRKEPQNPLIPETYLERRTRTCEWPSGEPGTSSYSECGAPRHGHAPYCEEHCIRAVRKTVNGKPAVEYGQWTEGRKTVAI